MEKDQSGHEHRQDDQQKKTIQDHSQNRDQQKGEGNGFGKFNHGLTNLLGTWKLEVEEKGNDQLGC